MLGLVLGVLSCLFSSRLNTYLQDKIVWKILQSLLGKHSAILQFCGSSGDIRADDKKTTSASSPLMVMK